MPIEIKMPALSPTMETGTLAKWLVKEGDEVSAGDTIAEIETDKATMEVEAADEGTLGRILVKEGSEDVPVGQAIALLLEEGEDKAALEGYKPQEKKGKKAATEQAQEPKETTPSPRPSPPRGEGEKQISSAAPGGGEEASEGEDMREPSPLMGEGRVRTTPARDEKGERVKASPLARRIAREKGVDLVVLSGSGPGGRIVRADVEGAEAAAPAAVLASGMPLEAPKEEIRVSSTRKIIAKRLLEAKQTIPHYYLTIEADITRLLALRKEINAAVDPKERVSLNDYIIKAAALAMMRIPSAHVRWQDGKMFRMKRADISVAVAIPDGLITPIIRGADIKPLRVIAAEMRVLAKKAREGKLVPQEYQGGTFSISNLGMFGIKDFAAVINPPQSGILAIGAGEERPLLKNGALENHTFMSMTGSFDHRAVDGAVGAKLMKTIKDLLERPAVLLY